MKKYFIYCTPCAGVKTYIGIIWCDKVIEKAGIKFFWLNNSIIASLVSEFIEIEDRTEPDV